MDVSIISLITLMIYIVLFLCVAFFRKRTVLFLFIMIIFAIVEIFMAVLFLQFRHFDSEIACYTVIEDMIVDRTSVSPTYAVSYDAGDDVIKVTRCNKIIMTTDASRLVQCRYKWFFLYQDTMVYYKNVNTDYKLSNNSVSSNTVLMEE